jgi:nitrate/nitrite-specific signal transduction histidine kinase
MSHLYEVDLARENEELTKRFVAAELQNTRLANLYVSMQRLHCSLERREIIAAIEEIVINLVGSEEFAILELVAPQKLSVVSSHGIDGRHVERVATQDGPIGKCVSKGTLFVRNGGPAQGSSEIESQLTACIPLRAAERIWGAVAVFALLPQKESLGVADVELFDLLSAHGGLALYCSSLHQRQGRR